jgi:hypothetical protein
LMHHRQGTQPPLLHLYENSSHGLEPERIRDADI